MAIRAVQYVGHWILGDKMHWGVLRLEVSIIMTCSFKIDDR